MFEIRETYLAITQQSPGLQIDSFGGSVCIYGRAIGRSVENLGCSPVMAPTAPFPSSLHDLLREQRSRSRRRP